MNIFDVVAYGVIVFSHEPSRILITWNEGHTFNVWTQGSDGEGNPIDRWHNTECFTAAEQPDIFEAVQFAAAWFEEGSK